MASAVQSSCYRKRTRTRTKRQKQKKKPVYLSVTRLKSESYSSITSDRMHIPIDNNNSDDDGVFVSPRQSPHLSSNHNHNHNHNHHHHHHHHHHRHRALNRLDNLPYQASTALGPSYGAVEPKKQRRFVRRGSTCTWAWTLAALYTKKQANKETNIALRYIPFHAFALASQRCLTQQTQRRETQRNEIKPNKTKRVQCNAMQ